jgi:hypothetical protein
MIIANASEFVKAHTRWIWEAPEHADERTVAVEAVAAVFDAAGGWLDIAALEARIGLYDHEIFTEADTRPKDAFHLLRSQSIEHVRIKPMYRPIESVTAVLNTAAAIAWVEAALSDVQISERRYEPSLRELLVAGSRARLPESDSSERLRIRCYAGEIEVPVDHGWVTAPSDPPGVPNPVALRLANLDGILRLVIDVFWSPWAEETEPVPAIRDGLIRLETRGWRADE